MANTYHVAKTGSDRNPGSKERPFLTIGAAADVARAGDTVVVHEGEYREWVKPKEGGLSDTRRIVYQAAQGEKAVIKGSERIQNWENAEGTIWKAKLPNTFFGDYNPYAKVVAGDWPVYPTDRSVHLGDVYLNGMSFYEAESYEALKSPAVRTEVLDHWTRERVPVKNPEQTKYVWFTQVDAENTTICANFHGADPNRELTRSTCVNAAFILTERA